MKLKVFSLYDSKIKAYSNPFFMHATGEALRGFTEVVNDPSTKLNKYPEDFTLFLLGEFDYETGKFDNLNTPESLATAISVKQ